MQIHELGGIYYGRNFEPDLLDMVIDVTACGCMSTSKHFWF